MRDQRPDQVKVNLFLSGVREGFGRYRLGRQPGRGEVMSPVAGYADEFGRQRVVEYGQYRSRSATYAAVPGACSTIVRTRSRRVCASVRNAPISVSSGSPVHLADASDRRWNATDPPHDWCGSTTPQTSCPPSRSRCASPTAVCPPHRRATLTAARVSTTPSMCLTSPSRWQTPRRTNTITGRRPRPRLV